MSFDGTHVRNAPSDDWESLVFYISNSFEEHSSKCRKYSAYYCLASYETPDLPDEVAATSGATVDKVACSAWFEVLIRHEWRRINYIDEIGPYDCCDVQIDKYLHYGLRNRQMLPDAYFSKLTDYSNETKQLNHVS
ncbi:uncharacterized protein LOC142355779, partial [Convolutriloba macropyga]|uniref:uncharacterized protein LOC142355779 n=1 Tax=Convolutriloba macropyga TaxID=536237 RepID=UPI003F51E068